MLHLEQKALYQPNTPTITVHLSIADEFAGAPVASIPITADDAYEPIAVFVPETKEKMRPLKLSFSSTPEAQLYLRERRFEE
jgi:hypothetical protein